MKAWISRPLSKLESSDDKHSWSLKSTRCAWDVQVGMSLSGSDVMMGETEWLERSSSRVSYGNFFGVVIITTVSSVVKLMTHDMTERGYVRYDFIRH